MSDQIQDLIASISEKFDSEFHDGTALPKNTYANSDATPTTDPQNTLQSQTENPERYTEEQAETHKKNKK